MYADIESFILECLTCAKFRNPKEISSGALPATNLFERWAIDFVGPLTMSRKGNRYILVAIDMFSRFVVAKASTVADSKEVAKFVVQEISLKFGVPCQLLSDRGSHFVNSLIDSLSKVMNTERLKTTSYNPQCNGMCERANGILTGIIKKICVKNIKDWDKYVDTAVYYHRTTKNREIGIAPFTLVYGQQARLWPGDQISQEEDEIRSYVERLESTKSNEHFREFLQGRDEAKYGKKMRERVASVKFKVGDKVMIVDSALANSKSSKMEPKNHGPYEIGEVLPNGNFRIKTHRNFLSNAINGRRLVRIGKQKTDPNLRSQH